MAVGDQARGQLDGVLKIPNEEELPVCERLGDVRELLVARAKVATALLDRGHKIDGTRRGGCCAWLSRKHSG